jgi:hypothetical protein
LLYGKGIAFARGISDCNRSGGLFGARVVAGRGERSRALRRFLFGRNASGRGQRQALPLLCRGFGRACGIPIGDVKIIPPSIARNRNRSARNAVIYDGILAFSVTPTIALITSYLIAHYLKIHSN